MGFKANALGHSFIDARLLEQALTHRSAGRCNNERLEFLGDALLNLIVAEFVFEQYPRASEGEMTRARASLVNGAALAELAREARIGEHLVLGPGELKTGGFPLRLDPCRYLRSLGCCSVSRCRMGDLQDAGPAPLFRACPGSTRKSQQGRENPAAGVAAGQFTASA